MGIRETKTILSIKRAVVMSLCQRLCKLDLYVSETIINGNNRYIRTHRIDYSNNKSYWYNERRHPTQKYILQ